MSGQNMKKTKKNNNNNKKKKKKPEKTKKLKNISCGIPQGSVENTTQKLNQHN